jgi:hypothetical protein
MELAPGRIAVAGDWHGNTAWATRADRGGRLVARGGDHRTPGRIGHRGRDRGNWAILHVTSMRWLRFAGRPISNVLRGLVSG